MCKKMTVAYGDFIGQRMVGWCVFNGKDYGFYSDKKIKAKLEQGEVVNGLTLDPEGNVVMDAEFTPVLMGKSGLTFAPINAEDADDAPVMNKYYALVSVRKTGKDTRYGFITNRCGYEEFNETQLKAMLEIFSMGGVKLDPKGKITVHRNVEVENISTPKENADISEEKTKN